MKLTLTLPTKVQAWGRLCDVVYDETPEVERLYDDVCVHASQGATFSPADLLLFFERSICQHVSADRPHRRTELRVYIPDWISSLCGQAAADACAAEREGFSLLA